MTTNHRMTTTAALILTLAGVAAPAATARPAEDPATPVSRTPASVYSRPDKSLIPASPPATSGAALSAYREGQLATALDVAATAANKASAPQAVVRVHAPQSGFDWGDAGIGAAGGIGLAMLVTGGGLVLVRMRRDHLDTATR